MPNWDIVVIGGGASGLTAAATAAGTGLSTLVIDRMGGSGELMNLGPLRDLEEPQTGPDLAARLLEEAVTAGAELSVAEVTGLVPEQTGWRIATDDETHHARAVILAIGLAPGTLGLANEQDFEGRGLSHCAACDAPLFQGEPVVVAGADRWAQQEARELAAIASKVTLITQGGAAPTIDTVTIFPGRIVALEGKNGLDSVLVQLDRGGAQQRIPTQAVFVQTGRSPASGFASAALARDKDGRVVTDATLQTNLPGLFAAGDASAGSPRTLAAAMADGRRAAASAQAARPIT
jgi:thioredoxin reductase (NADPH)